MRRFRPPASGPFHGDVTDLFAVGAMIDAAMAPGNFFVDPSLRCTWICARAETIPWEIFRGRLLPRTQTREEKIFLSWHVMEPDATEPTISVKLDVSARQLFVTRGFLAYVWEAVGDGVIDSRETVAWTRELVGSIALEEYADLEDVHDELICLLWQAVVGTSRLPLTSVEAPLPHFSFGKLHYFFRHGPSANPDASLKEIIPAFVQMAMNTNECAKMLEFALRRASFLEGLEFLGDCWGRKISLETWRAMFNNISLSPYTGFVENALKTMTICIQPENQIDFRAHLLKQLCRHLTAYDLVTFHHRGANYPDAFLLDEVFQGYLASSRSAGDSVSARYRRGAMRATALIRRHYESHFVPDTPTSPGENARVLPASHPRVPEEQLTQTTRRRKQLYADSPLSTLLNAPARAVLAQSVRDLEHIDERVEMGLGLFIDRPLGYAKAIGEPDLTPMIAHEAFSPAIARRRWVELKKLCAELNIEIETEKLDALFASDAWPTGLPHIVLAECPRPTAALADVRKVAADFVILRTLPRGLKELLECFDWQPLLDRHRLSCLAERRVRICAQVLDERQQPVIALFDDALNRRVEMVVDTSSGFVSRAGLECPRGGLRVLRLREDGDSAWREVDMLIRQVITFPV